MVFGRLEGIFFFSGKMPKNKILSYEWFDTPNIHLCSVKDFIELCNKNRIIIKDKVLLDENGKKIPSINFLENLFSYQVIFCVSKK